VANFFDTASGLEFANAAVSSVVYEIATNATATVSGDVGVSSISIPVGVSSISTPVTASSVTRLVGVSTVTIPVGVSSGTWLAGVSSLTTPVGVSSISIPVSVSSGTWLAGVSTVTDKLGYTITAAQHSLIADALLVRNVSSGGDGGRTVAQALYVLRNKVDAGTGIVYETDDTTSSWSFSVSTQPSDPIVSITPN
jgi:hypothetical protein